MKKVMIETAAYVIGTTIFLSALGAYLEREGMGFLTQWYEILIFFIAYSLFLGTVNYRKQKKKEAMYKNIS